MTLLPHQPSAYKFLSDGLKNSIGRCHGDPAGTGKTLPALMCAYKYTPIGKICLYVTLASAKYQVEEEMRKFSILFLSSILNGNKTARSKLLRELKDNRHYTAPDLLIINYEQILIHWKELSELPVAVIVADECSRLTNHKNKTWKYLYHIAEKTKALRLALSGTPIKNTPMEAWSLFTWLNPGSLGRWFSFANTYMSRTQFSMIGAVRTDMLTHLAARLQPYYMRREREELLPDLPELMEQTIPIELNDKEAKLYKQLQQEILFDIDPKNLDKIETPHTIQNGIVKFIRLRQLCVNPALLGSGITSSSKLTALQEFLSTLGDSKAIIFTEFASAVPAIMDILPEKGAVSITGATSQEQRKLFIGLFQFIPKVQFLVGTRAIEMALNLHAADFVIHLDPPMTYASYDQRISRARRQGRKDKVVSVRIVSRGTIEEKIYRLIEKKKNISIMAMPYTELVKELFEE